MRCLTYLILLAATLRFAPALPAQSLTDPGPVWAGLADTTAFSARMERHVTAADEALEALRAVQGSRTVENTVVPYKTAERQLDLAGNLAGFALNTHPDAGFRAYAQAWQARISERTAALGGDPALYEALAAVDLTDADPSLRYIVERNLDTYRRNGIDRSAEVRERVAALRAQIQAVSTRFERNIFSNRDTLRVHPDSLAGLPEDWLAAHSPGDDSLITAEITPTNAFLLLTSAERPSIREAAFQALFMAAYPANVPVLDSLRTLRHELATLLGYDSWAAYAAEPMMAGSPQRIRRFLNEVGEASAEVVERELAELLERRRVEEPWAEGIASSSAHYWLAKVKQEASGFDAQAMREYLPYDRVRDGILASFAQIFELEFRPAPETPVWSPAVEPYEVWEDGAIVGRIYLDMHPREGKFTLCGVSDLRLGGGAVPEVALVCNFPGGTEGDPGLLQPFVMPGFFHEFGHLVHFLFQGRSAMNGSVEWDFIEAPSQLLEMWVGDPAVLRSFARHYETGEPIPEEMIAAYRRSEGFGRAFIGWAFGLPPAILSLELHEAPPEEDPTAAVEARAAAVSPFKLPDGFSVSFPHLALYSSTYYTYLWSAVIACDLLTGFDRDDLLDPNVGRRYRDTVLAPAGTAPAAVLVERFLGRPFNADAWRAWLEGEEGGR